MRKSTRECIVHPSEKSREYRTAAKQGPSAMQEVLYRGPNGAEWRQPPAFVFSSAMLLEIYRERFLYPHTSEAAKRFAQGGSATIGAEYKAGNAPAAYSSNWTRIVPSNRCMEIAAQALEKLGLLSILNEREINR